MLIANCLSCLVNIKSDTCKDDPTLDLQIANLGFHNDIKIDWSMIRQQTMQGRTLVKLATVIQKGWPESQSELPDDIKSYFLYRVDTAYCGWNSWSGW